MIDDTQDKEKTTSSKNNRMQLHESMTAVKLNEDMEWLAKSEALGKGAAYYHPTPGYDEFLAYCSWRFHEPIPVEDIQSITTIFKRLSDLGLPSSRYFLELRDLGEDSVFTVFAPDYEEWYAHIWDLELLRA